MDESAASPPPTEPAPAAAPASAPVPASPPVARSIGERLRSGRERTGMSIPAAAEKLHLDPKVIEALEADRFAELGAPVYVRGHLKRYAEFSGESAVELINMYNAREVRTTPPDLTQIPHPERRADPRRLVPPLLVAGCAGLLLGAVWWVLAGSRSDGTVAAGPMTPLVPADATPVAGASATLAATPASLITSTPAAIDAAMQPAAASAAAPAPAPASAGAASNPAADAPPARSTRLRLEMTSDSWVEIYDSRGERLFYDVASAGSVQSVEGRGPLRVVLGNATGVAVVVDDERRQIPDAALDGEGARFVVNRSGSLTRAR